MLAHSSLSQKMAIALALLAGFIDALGYLSLGGVFVSFMSGNSTRFAVGISDGTALYTALIPLGIIALFVVGVMIGRAIRHFSSKKPSTAILAFMSVMLISAGLLHGANVTTYAIILMTLTMGAANNIFFRGGEVSVGVTYMTGTLVKFGQRLAGRLLGEQDHNWLPYLLLWIGLVTGAILGAVGYLLYGLDILWAGIILCLVLALISFRYEGNAAL